MPAPAQELPGYTLIVFLRLMVFLLLLQLAEHHAWGGWRRQAQKVTVTILGVKKIN